MKRNVTIVILLIISISMGCIPSDTNLNTQDYTKANKTTLTGPVIEIKERTIDLGTIPPETSKIVGNIHFFNAGDEALRVNEVEGRYACFMGHSGDELLQPQENGELQVKFDKSKIIGDDPVKLMVRIKTNDPVNSMEEVYFTFNIEPIEQKLRKLNTEVSKLRKELRAVQNNLKKVLTKLDSNAKPEGKKVDTTVYNITVGSSPILGPKDAPVTIVEFADFQCPYCIREYPTIKEMLKRYPDKIKFVFKHYPLKFHKKARPVHAAIELANITGGSGTFWKMHDMIIANPKKLEIADMRGYAKSLGLDMTKFDEVMSDESKIDELLKADFEEVVKCNVSATPTIFINGLKLNNRTIQGYEKRIKQILEKTKASN